MVPACKQRYSEIALLVVLVFLISLVRIYYGDSHGIMVVWKSQPSFVDTLVNLSEVTSMPAEELKEKHPAIYWQLISMDVIDDNVELDSLRKKHAVPKK